VPKTTTVETPVAPTKKEPPVVVDQSGWLALKVQPWAHVSSIKNAKGNAVQISQFITPCKIELQPGKYEITLTNSQFKPMVVQVEIQPKQVLLISKTMEGFDYAKAVDSLGL
jgi:hypothetical protein